MKKIIVYLLLFMINWIDVYSQDVTPIPITRLDILKEDGRNTLNSVLFVYAQPSHWKKKNWLTAGGIALGTMSLFLLDENVQPYFIEQEKKIPKFVSHFAFYFGKPQYNYGLTAAVYTVGWLTKNPKLRKTGVMLIASATAAGLIQTVSKNTFGRARPSTGVGNSEFDFFNGTPDYHSFPSGHTILAFTTAHVLAKQTQNPYLKVGIYGLGLVTPISRLWTNAHWLSDVGLSLAISVVTANSVDRFMNGKKTYESRTSKISWKLKAGPSNLGLVGVF